MKDLLYSSFYIVLLVFHVIAMTETVRPVLQNDTSDVKLPSFSKHKL